MKRLALLSFGILFILTSTCAQEKNNNVYTIFSFGQNGQLNTIYDARQGPNAVLVDETLFLVFNGDGKGEVDNFKTKPQAVTFDLASETFSEVVTLGPESSDHHNSPVIWVDTKEKIHVFHGWHNDLGKHLVSDEALDIGSSLDDWAYGAAPSSKMSYEWMRRIYDNKQLVVYRTDGHTSSWTYRITSDDGSSWYGPEKDVVDLDVMGGMLTDWSSYHAKAVSHDGHFLYLAFHAYDDFKTLVSPEEIASGKKDVSREYNPLYDNRRVSYNYNLYFLKIDLRTDVVMNFDGDTLQTPVDLEQANLRCMIWDTEWRGGSIIPSMLVDKDEQVSFLHNISNEHHEDSLDYHYYRFTGGEWKETRITHSNHEWNCSYLSTSEDGTLHAYLITGEGYLQKEGYMDGHGGGRIEEWISSDDGNSWQMLRDLTPDASQYPGWKYNNIQPVIRPDGSVVDGMLIFYGWKESDRPGGKAFLLIEKSHLSNMDAGTRPKDNVSVYPNPVTDVLNVKLTGEKSYNLAIYDITGALKLVKTNITNGTSFGVDHFDSGIYLLNAFNDIENYSIKFFR